MDDNTKEVLVLLITTLSTLGIAWLRIRGVTQMRKTNPDIPIPPDPTVPSDDLGV